MTVRAKFRVDEVAATVSGSTVRMSAVTSGSEENKTFFKWTPSAQLSMGTVNVDAAAEFKPGDEFYVDFTKAEKVTP